MSEVHCLRQSLEELRAMLNTIKTSSAWLDIMKQPAAHPSLKSDIAACLTAVRDLQSHAEISLSAVQQARQKNLLQEVQQEAA